MGEKRRQRPFKRLSRSARIRPEAVVPWPDRAQKNKFIPASQKVPDGSCSGVIEQIFPSAPYLGVGAPRDVERGWSR